MNIRCLVILLVIYALTRSFAYSQVYFPVLNSDAVKEVFHQYSSPLVQMGIRSYGDVVAIAHGRVVFVSDTMVEILTSEGMRVRYLGIRPVVSIGTQVAGAVVVGKSDDSAPWYMRIRDEIGNIWVDPMRIFPQVLGEKRITMRLVDFEFMYGDGEKSVHERRVIRRMMPSGTFRAIVTVSIRDVFSKHFLLPTYIAIRIGSNRFAFTQEELFVLAEEGSDVITIEDVQVYVLLPSVELSRGYYTATITVQGPLSTHKNFSFSFFAR